MKPFKINRNTWHYKLNQKLWNDVGWDHNSMKCYWEPKHKDFCSYWRATMFRIIGLTLCISSVGVLVFTFGMLVYQHPIEVLKVVGLIIATIAAIAGLAWASEKLKERRQIDAPEGLVSQRYRAYKSKICPMVEYDE